MKINKFLRNTIIYFLLFVGYIFIYVIDIESYLYNKKETEIESKSKVNFIYQQF